MLGLQNEREWSTFCEHVLMRPDLATDPRYASNSRRSAAREQLHGIIVGVFAGLTATEVLRRLDEARIANAQVNDMHDVWQHPQLAARHRWRDVASPAGPIPALLPPGMDDAADPQWGAVPALGEHTDSILADLGYSTDRIAKLRADGAI
jgi:itaconate CoA-transferase